MLVGSGQSLAHRHIALPARAASYEALQHAVGAGDDAAIIDNAERLLSQIGKDNEDPRTMPAASVFSEAMLRQVLTLQQRGQREDAQQLLARYHQAAVRPPLSTLRRVPLIEQVQP